MIKKGDSQIGRGRRRLDDAESDFKSLIPEYMKDGFEKYLKVCDIVESMDNAEQFSTICELIGEYQEASDKTLDEVLSEFKECIERRNKILKLLKETKLIKLNEED